MSHRTIQGMHIFGFTIQFNRYLAFLFRPLIVNHIILYLTKFKYLCSNIALLYFRDLGLDATFRASKLTVVP